MGQVLAEVTIPGTAVATDTALTELWAAVHSAFEYISHNSILMTMLVASVVFVAVRLFKKLKRAAKA